jgi:hypothetical protein
VAKEIWKNTPAAPPFHLALFTRSQLALFSCSVPNGYFGILDNNYPEKIEWLDESEFKKSYSGGGGGWTIILLDPGPPPPPHNKK